MLPSAHRCRRVALFLEYKCPSCCLGSVTWTYIVMHAEQGGRYRWLAKFRHTSLELEYCCLPRVYRSRQGSIMSSEVPKSMSPTPTAPGCLSTCSEMCSSDSAMAAVQVPCDTLAPGSAPGGGLSIRGQCGSPCGDRGHQGVGGAGRTGHVTGRPQPGAKPAGARELPEQHHGQAAEKGDLLAKTEAQGTGTVRILQAITDLGRSRAYRLLTASRTAAASGTMAKLHLNLRAPI